MPRPEELRLTEFASDDSEGEEDIFSNSIIHRYESKQRRWSRWKLCMVSIGTLCVLLLALATGLSLYHFRGDTCDTTTGLLPGNVLPRHYNLWLHPNLTTLRFQARVDIEIEVLDVTRCLTLNSLEQNVTKISLKQQTDKDGQIVEAQEEFHLTDFSFIPEHEFLAIKSPIALAQGRYTLTIHYHAEVRHALKGFYRSYYTTAAGEQRVAAVTQFEATFARHAFPCFDEPQYKASFSIAIVRDTQHTALSNMPEKEQLDYGNGLVQVNFKRSVKMSTYLVAFMVMDFTSRNSTTKSGKLIRVWSRSETHHQTEYALKCAVNLMNYYEEKFGIEFPLPKQDLVAVPDFNSGAMENWGLITYRETSILYDPRETSSAFKRRVVSVVAHEMAHQWFGNLVTMKWWNDLWLNEGFASYMEYVASDEVEPDMNMDMYLQKNAMQRALSADSFSNSHPISSEANTPSAIAEMFDAISYRKGACILRMLNKVMRDYLFFEGINKYLTQYEYSNAEQSQLYLALNETAQQELHPSVDISRFMESWTLQMGYPVVHVALDRSLDRVNISQIKYKFGNLTDPTSPLGYKWMIPFWYSTGSEATSKHEGDKMVWLTESYRVFTVPEDTHWILGNTLSRGFYRVTYTPDLWEEIITILQKNHQLFSEADRMKIMDDLTSLSQVRDDVDVTWALRASSYLKDEQSLYALTGCFTSLSRVIGKLAVLEEYKEAINRFYLSILEPVISRIGMQPSDADSFENKLFRGAVLTDAAHHGHTKCIEFAQDQYESHRRDGTTVGADLYEFVYGVIAVNCSESQWDELLAEYTQESLQSKQRYLMKALASTTNKTLIRRLLHYTMDESKIRRQDTRLVLMYVSMGGYPANYETWLFIRENWDYFYDTFGHTNSGFDILLESVVGQFYLDSDISEVIKFFDNKSDLGSLERGVKKGLEAANHRKDWMLKHRANAGGWLTSNFGPSRQ